MLQGYFKILGISENASISEIKKAYRKKVMLYHPDVSNYENAHEEFIRINEAYRGLLNYKLGKKSSKYVSHEEWLKTRRERAKREAARHAKIKYEEFKRTNLYRTTKVVTSILYYIYIMVGILMIISPIINLFVNGVNPSRLGESIAGTIIVILLGIVFVVALLATKKSFEY